MLRANELPRGVSPFHWSDRRVGLIGRQRLALGRHGGRAPRLWALSTATSSAPFGSPL